MTPPRITWRDRWRAARHHILLQRLAYQRGLCCTTDDLVIASPYPYPLICYDLLLLSAWGMVERRGRLWYLRPEGLCAAIGLPEAYCKIDYRWRHIEAREAGRA